MSKKSEQNDSFSALFKDVRPIEHDKYVPSKKDLQLKRLKKRQSQSAQSAVGKRQQAAQIELSDSFEAYWPEGQAIKYLNKNNVDNKDWLKKLSRGQVPPDLELDLHGLTAVQAKQEIISAIYEATKQHYPCIHIIHGHGNGVLKTKTPNWLIQHPDVAGFIQAPREYSGKAGLLVLIGLNFDEFKP